MRKRVQYEVWLPAKVDLSQPPGHPGESFFVSINGYYFGKIVKENGRWIPQLMPQAWDKLTIEDIRAMGDVIDDAYPEDSTDH